MKRYTVTFNYRQHFTHDSDNGVEELTFRVNAQSAMDAIEKAKQMAHTLWTGVYDDVPEPAQVYCL